MFDWVWNRTIHAIEQGGATPEPSPQLRTHLEKLYAEACRRPARDAELESAIASVLRYLDAETGKEAHDDYLVVSDFIMQGEEYWEEDWEELPERFVEILGIMGHELGQAAADPEWAETFGGTPGQILDQLAGKGQRIG